MTDEPLGPDELREALRRLLTGDSADPTLQKDRQDFIDGLQLEPSLRAIFLRLLRRPTELGGISREEIDVRQTVRASELAQDKDRAWHEYLDMLIYSEVEDLTPVQAVAHLSQRYYDEVYNGGHWQFFSNSSGAHAKETVPALVALGAADHAKVLARAIELVETNGGGEAGPYEIELGSPLAKSLWEVDRAHHSLKPKIIDLLRWYLDDHFGDFIRVIEDDEE